MDKVWMWHPWFIHILSIHPSTRSTELCYISEQNTSDPVSDFLLLSRLASPSLDIALPARPARRFMTKPNQEFREPVERLREGEFLVFRQVTKPLRRLRKQRNYVIRPPPSTNLHVDKQSKKCRRSASGDSVRPAAIGWFCLDGDLQRAIRQF